METSQTLRLDTDTLIDSAMKVARGGPPDQINAIHAELLKAARQFALLVEPAQQAALKIDGYDISVKLDGFRILVYFQGEESKFVISGPPGEPLMWIVDSIDSYPAEAIRVMRKASVGWTH